MHMDQDEPTLPVALRSGAGVPIDPWEVVFPLVAFDTPDAPFRVLGSAAFIGPSGLFLTARHCVVADAGEPLWDQVFGLNHHARPALWLSPAPISDLAIGQLGPPIETCDVCSTNRALCLTTWTPEENEALRHFGCAETPVDYLGKEDIDHILSHRPTVTLYSGRCLGFHPDGIGLVKTPCFLSNVEVPFSASGGPVASGLGRVCGVISSSSEGGGYTTVTPVRDILGEVFSDPVSLPGREPLTGATVRYVIEELGGEILGTGH